MKHRAAAMVLMSVIAGACASPVVPRSPVGVGSPGTPAGPSLSGGSVRPAATASPTPSLGPATIGAFSTAELGLLLSAPAGLPPGSLVVAQLHLTLVSPLLSCPTGAMCILGPAEWRVDGLSPVVTVDAIPDAPGLPSSGTSAVGLFALQGGPAKSGGEIALLGAVTPGPDGFAWRVAQAAHGSWSLALIEGWLGAVNYAWPCPLSTVVDPLTDGYGCGHGEWLGDTAAEPAAQQLTPPGALRVEAGAYALIRPDLIAAGVSRPPAQWGGYLVQAVGHSCPASSNTQIERCAWLKVLGTLVGMGITPPLLSTPPPASADPSAAAVAPTVP
ncbi:MAG: hypothetical protein ACLQBX_17615 [Candidatus Limnocylindrales bacterium]